MSWDQHRQGTRLSDKQGGNRKVEPAPAAKSVTNKRMVTEILIWSGMLRPYSLGRPLVLFSPTYPQGPCSNHKKSLNSPADGKQAPWKAKVSPSRTVLPLAAHTPCTTRKHRAASARRGHPFGQQQHWPPHHCWGGWTCSRVTSPAGILVRSCILRGTQAWNKVQFWQVWPLWLLIKDCWRPIKLPRIYTLLKEFHAQQWDARQDSTHLFWLAVLDASGEHRYYQSRFTRGLKGSPTSVILPQHCCISHPLLSSLWKAFGTSCCSRSSRRVWWSGALLLLQRGFWILKTLIAQHLIWRLKMAMETHNYLKYVFSSFLGREEEKLVSKKLLQVHNSPSEPRSSFHLSSQSDRSPAPTASSV